MRKPILVSYGDAVCVMELLFGGHWTLEDLWDILKRCPHARIDRKDWNKRLLTCKYTGGNSMLLWHVPRWLDGDCPADFASAPDPYPLVDILALTRAYIRRKQLKH